MSDDFLKTIKAIQSTGQAPANQNQTTNETVPSSKLIAEAQPSTAKMNRFALVRQHPGPDTNNNDD